MNRIQKMFAHGPVFAAYLMAGDGSIQANFEVAKAYLQGGANMLEIGIPFSDPVADGPIIQAAAERALKQGTQLADILELVKKIRQHSEVPIVLMSYYNPLLVALEKNFLQQAKAVGVDGLLIVDLPMEEAQQYLASCLEYGINPILMIAPNTPLKRIQKIAKQGKGFLYYACRAGTTGVKNNLPDDFEAKIEQIKSVTKLPILVGFGIGHRAMAQAVLQHADGFVVASLFVAAVAENKTVAEIAALTNNINPIGASL